MPPLMPGPTPKANDQRRRQNATIAMTQLPNEGYTGPVPVWPLSAASPAELVRWAWLWTRPQEPVRLVVDDQNRRGFGFP